MTSKLIFCVKRLWSRHDGELGTVTTHRSCDLEDPEQLGTVTTHRSCDLEDPEQLGTITTHRSCDLEDPEQGISVRFLLLSHFVYVGLNTIPSSLFMYRR
jgi:hypothetical protein